MIRKQVFFYEVVSSPTVPGGGGLLERDAELRACLELIAGIGERRGGLLVLEGSAGLGKSALLAQLRRAASAAGIPMLFTFGTELGRSVPFGVARRLLGPILRERPDLLDVGLASSARSVFDGRLGDAGSDPSPLVNGLITLLHDAIIAGLAGGGPGWLVVVDDLQWVDAASLRFLAELAERIEEVAAGVALGIRLGEPSADAGLVDRIRGAPQTRILELKELSDRGVARIVERELGELGDLGDAAARLVAHATAGNPLLVAELVATVCARGLEHESDLRQVLREAVPAAVARFAMMRLEPLGEDARELAQAAAILSEAPLHLVAQLAVLGIEAAEVAADALAARRILAPGDPVRFVHPLIAAAITSSIAPFRRSGMHRRVAELLADAGENDDLVAVHLLDARAQADTWATEVLRRAARSALARGEPSTAVGLLERALAEPPSPEQRGGVLLELARAQATAGDPGAIDRFQAALEQVDDPDLRSDAWHGLSRLLSPRGDFEGAAEAAARGRAELPDGDPRAERLLADELAAVVLLPDRGPAARSHSRALVQAVRSGAPPSAPGLLAHLVLHLGWCGEDLDLIPPLARQAVAGDPLIDPEMRGAGAVHVAGALNWIDDLGSSAAILDAAIARARELGDPLAEATLRCTRGWTHYYAGELAEAESQLDQVIAGATGWDLIRGLAGPPRALVALERDDVPRAQAAIALVGPATMAGAGWIRGRVSLAAGDAQAALDACIREGELLESVGMHNPTAVPWRSWAAIAAWRVDEAERARELAGAELSRARELGVPRGLGVSLRTAALCSAQGSSLALLEESVAVLESSPSRLDVVHSLVDLGAAQRRARQTLRARATLARALELADGIGALALARRARQELHASGAQPRRAARTGPGALTASERRIAELAAAGRSTREIATELFLSPRTIDGHLAAVYRKLGIGSRRQIAARLAVGVAEPALEAEAGRGTSGP